MTVSELIEILKDAPQSAVVKVPARYSEEEDPDRSVRRVNLVFDEVVLDTDPLITAATIG